MHLTSPLRRHIASALAAFAALVLTGCGVVAERPSAGAVSPRPHGYVEGAEELDEAQLSLVVGDSAGTLTMLDLAGGERTSLTASAAAGLIAMSGDGRFVYPSRDGRDAGVDVVDTGRWTTDHGDHFHFHRAPSRVVGTVSGGGAPVIRSADRHTAIAFPANGELVLLAHDDLAEGDIGESLDLALVPHAGMLALPYAGHTLVTAPDAAGAVATITALDARGEPVPGIEAPCAGASDAVSTRVGAVFACADGAVLVTASDRVLEVETIPYPDGVAAPARTLDGRIGRPSVAGAAGHDGVWRLDARQRQWAFLPSEIPLVAVSAVSDDESLIVAVDAAGSVRVFDATGHVVGVSAPIVAASVATPDAAAHVRLIVDADRAYVSGPVERAVFEVDYRDGARITRTFDGLDPTFLERVG